MATFLTTSKMDPALAARVDASVRGRRKKPGATFGPRVVALLRFAVVVAIVVFVSWLFVNRSRGRQELEVTRAALLDDVKQKSGTITAFDLEFVARADAWMMRAAGDYEGDVVADELRAPGAFAATLARPIVYVRGSFGSFGSTAGIADLASTSAKDPFLLCLMEPPASRTEKILLAKVRLAYAGSAPLEQSTANVRRLQEAIVGLPLLRPQWAARVQGAQDLGDLAKLRKELDRAPVDRAKLAARSELLLFAMDEVGDGPTELDGERAHAVRITLVDLTAAKVLLRVRKSVDPKWISVAMRPEFASGLDGCALAIDVHEAVRAQR